MDRETTRRIRCPFASDIDLDRCLGSLCGCAVAIRTGAGRVWVCGMTQPTPNAEVNVIDTAEAGPTINVMRPGERF